MIKGYLDDFIEKLDCGDEVIFTCKGGKFFIQGVKTDGKYTLCLDRREQPATDCIRAGVGDDKDYPAEAGAEVEWVGE